MNIDAAMMWKEYKVYLLAVHICVYNICCSTEKLAASIFSSPPLLRKPTRRDKRLDKRFFRASVKSKMENIFCSLGVSGKKKDPEDKIKAQNVC